MDETNGQKILSDSALNVSREVFTRGAFKRIMSEPGGDCRDVESSLVLKRVASLSLSVNDKAFLEVTKPKFVPEKLDFKLYEKFEGHMLINWYLSEFTDESSTLIGSRLGNTQDFKVLAAQFCTHLLAAGVLRQIPDKDTPMYTTFKPDLMYYWAHSEIPQSVPETPGRLSYTSWPPTSPGSYTDIPTRTKSPEVFEEMRSESKLSAKEVEILALEEEVTRLKQEIEKYKTLIEIQNLTAQTVKDFGSPAEDDRSITCKNCDSSLNKLPYVVDNNNSETRNFNEGDVVETKDDDLNHISPEGQLSLHSCESSNSDSMKFISLDDQMNSSTSIKDYVSCRKGDGDCAMNASTCVNALEALIDIKMSDKNNDVAEEGQIVSPSGISPIAGATYVSIPSPPPLPLLNTSADLPPPPPPLPTFGDNCIPPPLPPMGGSAPLPQPISSISGTIPISPSRLTTGEAPPPIGGLAPLPPPMAGICDAIPPPPPPPGSVLGVPPPPPPPTGDLAPLPPPMQGLSGPVPPPPPPMGGPAPLPPPPVGGWSAQKSMSQPPPVYYQVLRKNPIVPPAPMKPLYWTRILVQSHQEYTESVPLWSQLEEVHLDNISEFADLFSRQVVAKKPSSKKVEVKSKVEPKKLLDSKRSKSVGILAQSLHVDFHEIETAIYDLDTSVVNLEALQHIYEARATAEELKNIKAHLDENPIIPLDKPEQFLYDLSKIANFAERIFCFMFQAEFDDSITTIENTLANMKSTCEFLTTSNSLRELFAVILTLGNYMNGGNLTRGQADGFGLEILSKLKDVKSKDSQVTLLHFIVQCCLRKIDVVSDTVTLPIPEPGDVERASTVNFDDIRMNLNKLQSQIEECNNRAQKVINASTLENLEPFREKITKFLESARKRLSTETENLKDCREIFTETMKFYHFRSKHGNLNDVIPVEFFDLWFQFCKDFKDIWKKECTKLEKERIKDLKKRSEKRLSEKVAIKKREDGLKAKVAARMEQMKMKYKSQDNV